MRCRRCVADAISQATAEKTKWISSYTSLKTKVGKQTDLAEKLQAKYDLVKDKKKGTLVTPKLVTQMWSQLSTLQAKKGKMARFIEDTSAVDPLKWAKNKTKYDKEFKECESALDTFTEGAVSLVQKGLSN